jgi:acetylornithine aminotransferase
MPTEELKESAEQYLMGTYTRQPISIVRGRGTKVYDLEGREYVDFVGGIAVNILGYGHPDLVLAIQKQAAQLLHTSNLYYTEPQVKLAQMLVDHSFADKVFFCNSGAEANEAAIKLARRYSHEKYGAGRFEIITMKQSFHGRTMATLTATGQEKIQKGYEPLLPGFSYVSFNHLSELEEAVTEKTAAIMLEPIQGEGGVHVAARDYLKAVRDLCTQKDILLIFDEVQTGMGRTGTLFAYEQFGVQPDVMTLAKGLGGGVPIGACLATMSAAAAFGMHQRSAATRWPARQRSQSSACSSMGVSSIKLAAWANTSVRACRNAKIAIISCATYAGLDSCRVWKSRSIPKQSSATA